MRFIKISIVIFGFILFANFANAAVHNFVPKEGYVPDAKTAIKIAEAVWLPICGSDIYDKKPFQAVLKEDVWHVKGSLPKYMVGGVPEIWIQKQDGKILRVTHGK